MSALVSAIDLLSEDPSPVLLDVQWNLSITPESPAGEVLYAAGHLPGATHLDLETDLSDPPGGRGRHPLPDPSRLQHLLRKLGLDDDSRIVVYDQGIGFGAARAWWVLRWAGLRDVRVLDGGLPAWRAAGGSITIDPAPHPSGTGAVTVRPGGMPAIDADGAARMAHEQILLDVRAPERYRGDTEPLDPVAGHIPGAVNAPTTATRRADGTFAGPQDLATLFAAYAIHPGDGPDRVAVSCGSGVSAAQTVLALHEIGVTAALYPGSWSEWVSDPSRPVATGPESPGR